MEEPQIELVPEGDIKSEPLEGLPGVEHLGMKVDPMVPTEPVKPRCFAYSPEGVRCELEPPHLGQDHTVAITWTDDEAMSPAVMAQAQAARLHRPEPTPIGATGTHEIPSGMLVERVAPTIPERPNMEEVECVACDADGHVGRLHKGENGACTVTDCYCERFVA